MTDTAAFYGYAAAVKLDQLLNDRKPKSKPTVGGALRRRRLAKAIKNERQNLLRDPIARIADGNSAACAGALEAHGNAPAARREFHGIAEEVPHNLLQPVRIAEHDAGRRA